MTPKTPLIVTSIYPIKVALKRCRSDVFGVYWETKPFKLSYLKKVLVAGQLI